MKTLTTQALEIVKDRKSTHGTYIDNKTMFYSLANTDLTITALCLKLARLKTLPSEDTYVDIFGYVLCELGYIPFSTPSDLTIYRTAKELEVLLKLPKELGSWLGAVEQNYQIFLESNSV